MTLLTDGHSGRRSIFAYLAEEAAGLIRDSSAAIRRYRAARQEESLGFEMRKDIGYRSLADHD